VRVTHNTDTSSIMYFVTSIHKFWLYACNKAEPPELILCQVYSQKLTCQLRRQIIQGTSFSSAIADRYAILAASWAVDASLPAIRQTKNVIASSPGTSFKLRIKGLPAIAAAPRSGHHKTATLLVEFTQTERNLSPRRSYSTMLGDGISHS
jgi:hypothetical protein